MVDPTTLRTWIRDARDKTLALVNDLTNEQLRTRRIPIVNPLDWEIGHVAFFQERFVLRDLDGRAPLSENVDNLYDSIAIDHEHRWDLPLPQRSEIVRYLNATRDSTLERITDDKELDAHDLYRNLLAVFHEDMHTEAFTYTRQTMGYCAPAVGQRGDPPASGPLPGDAEIPGGTFALGGDPSRGFVFDNENDTHQRTVKPFRIAKAPVTQSQFEEFIGDQGYSRRELWDDAGWQWRQTTGATSPLYWRRNSSGFERRDFERWIAVEPHRPMLHVNWFEAQAYCRWANRRLPTELEWEVAAAGMPDGNTLGAHKRQYPWGDSPPTPKQANMDWQHMGCVDVGALPEGDSAFGCRQMLGNVWEWCSDTFGPYPGFEPGPYKEYSAPLFGTTKVLRGGGWATRSRLIRNTWRNYYGPERRDVWAGFRTCAVT